MWKSISLTALRGGKSIASNVCFGSSSSHHIGGEEEKSSTKQSATTTSDSNQKVDDDEKDFEKDEEQKNKKFASFILTKPATDVVLRRVSGGFCPPAPWPNDQMCPITKTTTTASSSSSISENLNLKNGNNFNENDADSESRRLRVLEVTDVLLDIANRSSIWITEELQEKNSVAPTRQEVSLVKFKSYDFLWETSSPCNSKWDTFTPGEEWIDFDKCLLEEERQNPYDYPVRGGGSSFVAANNTNIIGFHTVLAPGNYKIWHAQDLLFLLDGHDAEKQQEQAQGRVCVDVFSRYLPQEADLRGGWAAIAKDVCVGDSRELNFAIPFPTSGIQLIAPGWKEQSTLRCSHPEKYCDMDYEPPYGQHWNALDDSLKV